MGPLHIARGQAVCHDNFTTDEAADVFSGADAYCHVESSLGKASAQRSLAGWPTTAVAARNAKHQRLLFAARKLQKTVPLQTKGEEHGILRSNFKCSQAQASVQVSAPDRHEWSKAFSHKSYNQSMAIVAITKSLFVLHNAR